MFRPSRDRQQCPTVSSPFVSASIKRGGRFFFVVTAFAIASVLPNHATPQTANGPIPTGTAIIPTDLPARASTAQTGNGPVSLLPGTIPARDTMGEEPEIPSLATQYHQTLTGAPVRPRPTKPAPAAPQGLPTTNDLSATVVVTSKPKPAAKMTAPVETALPATSATSGHHLIQLGAFRDVITAETYWASFRIRYPELAKSYEKKIIAADLGSQGIYHRLQLTGFVSPDIAKQQCRQLQADGTDCFAAN